MSHSETENLRKEHGSFIDTHLSTYLDSGGREGHIIDMSHVGVPGMLSTLLLKTVGRRSGRDIIVPLIYGCYGVEWVVIGSKAGAAGHPFWYLNLLEREEVFFQVATQCFRATWRHAEGRERDDVWAYMEHLFPPYKGYKQATEGQRVIPVVMLKPISPAAVFTGS